MEEDAEEIIAWEGAVHAETRDTQSTPRAGGENTKLG
jgi:hypothetical protein